MNKKNLVLGGVLIVLIIFSYLYQGPFQKWREESGKPVNFLAGVISTDVSKVQIVKAGKTITLLREGIGWKVEETKDFYVKDSVADSLGFVLENIGKKDMEVVSKNKDKKSAFETNESGIAIKIFQENKEFEFVVGKTTPDFSGSYVSENNNNKTYKLKLNLSVFDRTEWRDDQMFSFMKERVNKLRFQYPNKQFFVEKVEEEWRGVLPYSFPVSEEKIDEIIDIMASMSSTKIPEQKFEGTGLEKNLIIVQVIGEGIDETIMIGEAKEAEGDGDPLYFVKRGSSDNLYLITKEERDVFDKTTRDLR